MTNRDSFSADSYLERIQQAFERFHAVCEALNNMQQAFGNTLQVSGEPLEQMLKMLDTLSENLVARALAEEGLALIDQIISEIQTYQRNRKPGENTVSAGAAAVLEKVQATLNTQKEDLERFRDLQNEIIQSAMKSVQEIEKLVKKIKNSKEE